MFRIFSDPPQRTGHSGEWISAFAVDTDQGRYLMQLGMTLPPSERPHVDVDARKNLTSKDEYVTFHGYGLLQELEALRQ